MLNDQKLTIDHSPFTTQFPYTCLMKTLSPVCIALAAIALTFSSCSKKSSDNPKPNGTVTSSMKLTANGTDLSFNDCEEMLIEVNDVKQTTITGYMVTNGKPSDVTFQVDLIHDPATLKAGQTYQVIPGFAQPDAAIFYYFPNSTDIFSSQPGNPQGSVTITDVTSTTISGTFSVKLFASNDLSGTSVIYTITNGSFTARIIK